MAIDHSSQFPLAVLGAGRPGEILQQARRAAREGGTGESFAQTLRASAAQFRAETIATLLAGGLPSDRTPGTGERPAADGLFATLLGVPGAQTPGQAFGLGISPPGRTAAGIDGIGGAAGSTQAIAGLSPTGRNLALFDPESAYRMMTLINRKELEYQAEFAEMRAMEAQLADMQRAGQALAGIDGAAALRERLNAFVADYNAWVRRFDDAVQPGGLLAGTQAAQVARTALRNSIDDPFFGAADGFRGMAGLGVTLDRTTGLAELDAARFDAALAGQPDGAVRLVQEFGSSFARSAGLLVSADNFVSRRLGRLDDVIDYIADHRDALQAEFGLGDPAQPTGQVATALAAYRQAAAV